MQSSRLITNFTLKQVRNYSSPKIALPSMNELPSPKGDWRTHHEAANRRYNLQLVLGIGVFIGTLTFGRAMGWLNMHSDYPDKPADIKNYKALTT